MLPYLLLASAFLACGPVVKAPEIRLRSVAPGAADSTVVGLAVYNPNRFPLRVRSVNYEVSIGGDECGRGSHEAPLFLDARETTDVEFSISLDWGRVGEAIPSLLSDSVVFGVKGSYAVSTVLGRHRFGFEGRRTVSVKNEVNSLLQNLFEE